MLSGQRFPWLLCLIFTVLSSPVMAQGIQTTIVGLVRDDSGGVTPGVTIVVTNRATGVARTTVTGADGNYSVTSLVPGAYDVTAELSGFKTARREEVPVQAETTVRVDFTLSVGGIGETVVVQAEAVTRILRTEDASLGTVLNESQVQGLPVKNRNFMALVQLTPGATESLEGNQNSLGRTQPLNLSVHGQRHFDNNIRLDGVSIIAGFANGSTFIPSLESLKEVSVQTGQYGAAYGMYSGAQVDMVVKSGQNTPHGSAFLYHRQDELNARRYFDQGPPPPFDFNQFGATLGAPILRNRMFFFFGYEGTRSDRETTGTATTATEAFRRGDFSALSAAIRDPFTQQPFPGNIIPANRLAPQAQALMKYIPLPTRDGLANNYVATSSTDEKENQYFGRVDHQFSPSTSLFARVAVRKATIDTVQLNPNFKSFGQPENQNYAIGLTHVLSARWLLDVRGSFVRESTPNQTGREGADIDPLRDFGIGGLNLSDPLLRGIPTSAVTGYVGTGETFANPRLLYENPELQGHSVLELPGHSIRAGLEVFRRRNDFYSVNARNQGSFTFSGLLTGNAFADFILGLPDQTGRIPNVARASLRQPHFYGYIQDDWRAKPNLTINLGLRYEYAGSTEDALGIARNLDIDTLQLFPEPGQTAPLHDSHHDFAPRVSGTYRMGEATVVRAGYGLYYTQPTMANVALMFRNPPYNREDVFNTVRTNPTLTLANGFPEGSLAGSTATPTITTVSQGYGPADAQVWSANVQRQLWGEWVTEIGYVGSKTTGLDNAWTYNTPPPGAGAVQTRRPIPTFGDIRVFGTDARSEYNGVQVRGQHLDFYGMNLLTSYTYSHCNDTRSSPATSTVGTEDQEPQDQYNRFDGEWGRCAVDFRHVFKFNTVYQLRFADQLSGFARGVLADWQVGVGVNLHTGGPFNVIVSGNPANTSRGAIRPNLAGNPNLPADQRAVSRWFDTSAFTAPAPFTFGSAPRNVVEGPGRKLVDINFLKKVRFGGNALEFRVDLFNVFNTAQFNTPARTFGAPGFGTITSTGPAREVQLGARFTF
jgi:Carboxypeptidase regulatory-like domain/TonB dependent receptor-like, beta-barrel